LYADGYGNEVAQVLLNLIANAKDVLLERNIQNPYIQIHADQRDNQVEITILDNGKGVSIEPIEKIFEPYVSTKHASSGTGIGLYMSKIIIEKHSFGSLHVENTKEGALFTIFLPTP
jgi:signal transduction histidine kinase